MLRVTVCLARKNNFQQSERVKSADLHPKEPKTYFILVGFCHDPNSGRLKIWPMWEEGQFLEGKKIWDQDLVCMYTVFSTEVSTLNKSKGLVWLFP